MIHKKYPVSKCNRESSSVNNFWKMTTKILLRDMPVFLECHHGSISFLEESKHTFLVSDGSLTKDIMSVHGIVLYLKSGKM